MTAARSKTWPRYVFLMFAGISLLLGLVAALSLVGATSNDLGNTLAGIHGPLMVFGFVGGAIGLERAVAVNSSSSRTWWAWLGPLTHVLGVITLIGGAAQPSFAPQIIKDHPHVAPGLFFTISFCIMGTIYTKIHLRQSTLAILTQACGAIGGAAAAALFAAGGSFAGILPLASVFVVATIIGERLELARVSIAGANAEGQLTALVCATTAASMIYVAAPRLGYPLLGALLLATAIATARVDVARRMIKAKGLPKFSSAAMLSAYAWLAITGLIWLVFGQSKAGFLYDASVHTLFIGFTMSMILAHAPMILTGVIRKSLPYHPVMYVALALLHLGLIIRILSDARQATDAWRTGGVINVIALLTFIAVSVFLTVRGPRTVARK